MDKMSQSGLNRMVKKTRSEWRKMVKESGMSESEFLVQRKDEASKFIGEYTLIQKEVAKAGFKIPNLLKGVVVVFK